MAFAAREPAADQRDGRGGAGAASGGAAQARQKGRKEEEKRLNDNRLRAFKAGGHAGIGKSSCVDQFLEDKDRLALSLASKRDRENQQGLLFARLRKKALELPIRILRGHYDWVRSLAVFKNGQLGFKIFFNKYS